MKHSEVEYINPAVVSSCTPDSLQRYKNLDSVSSLNRNCFSSPARMLYPLVYTKTSYICSFTYIYICIYKVSLSCFCGILDVNHGQVHDTKHMIENSRTTVLFLLIILVHKGRNIIPPRKTVVLMTTIFSN